MKKNLLALAPIPAPKTRPSQKKEQARKREPVQQTGLISKKGSVQKTESTQKKEPIQKKEEEDETSSRYNFRSPKVSTLCRRRSNRVRQACETASTVDAAGD